MVYNIRLKEAIDLIDLIKGYLKNEIVVNWIAPIITGLIVIAIPAGLAKIIRIRSDIKKVNDANNRYLNCIRPYIIQKINISSKLISDLRSVVVDESDLKNKYVYSEIQLRNKLIMDITESKYIDEINKYELIGFTYRIFKEFEDNNAGRIVENDKTFKKFNFKNNYFIFIISLLILTIVSLFDKDGTESLENPAALFSCIICIFSILISLASAILNLFRSEVSQSKEYDYYTKNYKAMKKKLKLKEMQIKNKNKKK